MNEREAARAAFIETLGWGEAAVEALPADASARRYVRVRRAGASAIVMDAPPEAGEDVRPFIRTGRHLIRLGLSAPEILGADEARGFLLLEDFGERTFTRLLAEGHGERALYELATDSIIALQSAPGALEIDTTSYMPRFIAQLEPWLQFHVPEAAGRPASEECSRRFYAAWDETLRALPPPETTLMLRDYHVGNLMLLDRPGVKACGLLDFQDAEFAPRPYDLVCLLNDVRRDVPPGLRDAMLARYDSALGIESSFEAWYAAFAAQRLMRVAGSFTRQSVVNGRHEYRQYLPRTFLYLETALRHPALAPVRDWTARFLSDRAYTSGHK